MQFVAFFNNLTSFFTSLLKRATKLYPNACLPGYPAVLVHSSLSSFGQVPLGEQTVVNALLKACGNGISPLSRQKITLVMPAHSDLPAENGNRPFSRNATPCQAMGRIPDCFRRLRGVRRSGHPALSFCAKGPEARRITSGHRPETGLGPGSPIDALYRLDALVLMLGTGYDTCSVMHLAEYARDRKRQDEGQLTDRVTCGAAEYRWTTGEPGSLFPFLPRCRPTWKQWVDVAFHPGLFPSIGAAFEREHPGKVIRGTLANGEYRLLRVRDLVDFSIDRYPVLE